MGPSCKTGLDTTSAPAISPRPIVLFSPQRMLGNVWRHFWLSRDGHPLPNKDHPAKNVKGAKVEKHSIGIRNPSFNNFHLVVHLTSTTNLLSVEWVMLHPRKQREISSEQKNRAEQWDLHTSGSPGNTVC